MNSKNIFNLPKRIERIGVIETNSSSTHCLSICGDYSELIHRGDPDFNIEIGEDNILYLSEDFIEDVDFGWGWTKYNDCKTKLYYAIGLAYQTAYVGRTKDGKEVINYKKVTALKVVLCDYMGLSDIVLEWDEKYTKGNTDYLNYPTVDHQSVGSSYDQIFESSKTIIDFIFSRKSWLYVGNDNSDEPYSNFYKESFIEKEGDDKYDAIFRIDFGKYFEKQRFVDVPVKFYDGTIDKPEFKPGDPIVYGFADNCTYLGSALDNLYINTEQKKVEMIFHYVNDERFCSYSKIVQDNEGNLFIVYIPGKSFYGVIWGETPISKLIKEEYLSSIKDLDIIERINIVDLLKGHFVEEVDYFIFPITSSFRNFNTLGDEQV